MLSIGWNWAPKFVHAKDQVQIEGRVFMPLDSGNLHRSDIHIDAEGTWFYRGTEMSRHDIVALFYQHLRQDADGSYFIEIGQQRFPVDVEDTAYVVWALAWMLTEDGMAEYACLLLSDGSVESLDPETLRIGANHIPYCKVKRGRFDARLSRAAYYKLTEQLEHDPASDTFFIPLNGRRFCLE
jgi:uncharacterized protein